MGAGGLIIVLFCSISTYMKELQTSRNKLYINAIPEAQASYDYRNCIVLSSFDK